MTCEFKWLGEAWSNLTAPESPFHFGQLSWALDVCSILSVWQGDVFLMGDTKKGKLTVPAGSCNQTLCVVICRRHFLEKTYWTKASRADSRGWNRAYWKTARAKWRESIPLPVFWIRRQILCSPPQRQLFPPDLLQDVCIHFTPS